MALQHQFDEEGVCTICDFDGAEWQHLDQIAKNHGGWPTPMPPCKDKYGRINPGNPDDIFKE